VCSDATLRLRSGVQLRVAEDVAAASAAESGATQSTNSVLMVAPNAFASNEQAAEDNAFMAAARDGGAGAPPHDSVRTAVLAGAHAVSCARRAP
jgi:hypothetical protein